jgi:hypothetical protein
LRWGEISRNELSPPGPFWKELEYLESWVLHEETVGRRRWKWRLEKKAECMTHTRMHLWHGDIMALSAFFRSSSFFGLEYLVFA